MSSAAISPEYEDCNAPVGTGSCDSAVDRLAVDQSKSQSEAKRRRSFESFTTSTA